VAVHEPEAAAARKRTFIHIPNGMAVVSKVIAWLPVRLAALVWP
jgi:hypothetical protein